jgi:hypothetical protein
MKNAQALGWVCILLLSTGLSYVLSADLGSAANGGTETDGSSALTSIGRERATVPQSSLLEDPCAWDYTLSIGTDTHPSDC